MPDPSKARTIIVTGIGRSGTTAMIRSLCAMGLPIEQDAVKCRTQDDWEIGPLLDNGSLDEMLGVIDARNEQWDLWGLKWHQLYQRVSFIHRFRNPHIVIMSRDPLAIAIRAAMESEDSIEVWLDRVSFWQRQISNANFRCPVLYVSYEKLLIKPDVVLGHAARFCGLECNGQALAEIRPEDDRYLARSRQEWM